MRIAVVGAGITGLVAAHRLGAEGHSCDVYERWPGLGGQVATLDVGGGQRLEHYYHHLFTSDLEIAALYDELGMGEEIEWLPSSMAVFAEGRSHAFTTPLDLLRYRPLSLRSRLRMGAAVLRLSRRHKEAGELAEMSAHSWIEKNMGAEVWEKLWGPLLRAKFGNRAEDISMAWLWAKLTVRRRMEGSEARQEKLGYPRGGWQPLLERLRREVEGRGGQVLIDRPVAQIRSAGEGFRLDWGPPDSFRAGLDPRRFERAGTEDYDAVLATTPSDIFEEMLDGELAAAVGEDYIGRLHSISYHAALCVLLELDRGFSPFYWTNIADGELPFIGLIEQTNLIEPSRYGGRHFLYIANYLEPGHELLGLSNDELLARYEPGLRRVNPDYSPDWIRNAWIFREPAAQPIVDVGYAERIPPFKTPVPGLLLANTTQIYPEDRGTNYSVRLGNEVSKLIG